MLTQQRTNCTKKIIINPLFINDSTEENFDFGSFAFFINLQLCPVYITIPIIHLVFFNLAPFNKSCLASKGILYFSSSLFVLLILKFNSILPFN